MRSQDMIYASGIKGYCPTYVCWQYLHDISAQLVENDERDKYEAIALNNVRINGKNFCLIEKSCLKDIGYDDVRQLATSAFELILGIPMFNGIGEKNQTEKTPIPLLPGKEMETLNDLIHRCVRKDTSKCPTMSEIFRIASEELKKVGEISRKCRIYTSNTQSLHNDDYDKKWPEHIMNFKQWLICLSLLIIGGSSQIYSQTILNEDEEKYTLKLTDAVLKLRNNTQQSWDAAQYELSTLLRVFTMMDELQDVNNDCALIKKNVKSFGLNRMIKNLKESKNVVQNTGKGLLDGSDSRFNYSIYEKGVKKGCTATYRNLTGRHGMQVFIVIPYSANQPYKVELYQHDGDAYEPVRKDNNGITYYLIDTENGPSEGDSLILKIENMDTENNRSFVIINHNYRNKE